MLIRFATSQTVPTKVGFHNPKRPFTSPETSAIFVIIESNVTAQTLMFGWATAALATRVTTIALKTMPNRFWRTSQTLRGFGP